MVRALFVLLVIAAVTTALSGHSCSHTTAATAAAPQIPFFLLLLQQQLLSLRIHPQHPVGMEAGAGSSSLLCALHPHKLGVPSEQLLCSLCHIPWGCLGTATTAGDQTPPAPLHLPFAMEEYGSFECLGRAFTAAVIAVGLWGAAPVAKPARKHPPGALGPAHQWGHCADGNLGTWAQPSRMPGAEELAQPSRIPGAGDKDIAQQNSRGCGQGHSPAEFQRLRNWHSPTGCQGLVLMFQSGTAAPLCQRDWFGRLPQALFGDKKQTHSKHIPLQHLPAQVLQGSLCSEPFTPHS